MITIQRAFLEIEEVEEGKVLYRIVIEYIGDDNIPKPLIEWGTEMIMESFMGKLKDIQEGFAGSSQEQKYLENREFYDGLVRKIRHE